MTTIADIIAGLERLAPLSYQEDYDNAGLQVGFPRREVSKVLVCLDVTEAIVDEAAAKGCGLIVSHHPLIFRGLKQVSDSTYQQRCVVKALSEGIAIYSAHTNLDNAPGGVNHKIASLIGLQDVEWLQPIEGKDAGSGVIGVLPQAEEAMAFLARLKDIFGIRCITHSEPDGRSIRKVALCGGAGAFLMRDALRKGADCFLSGEFHYHDFFENDGMLLAELGHYQSEKFTRELLGENIAAEFPDVQVMLTELDTNPERYYF